MKNVVECQKEFFAYFNALGTRGDLQYQRIWLRFLTIITELSDTTNPDILTEEEVTKMTEEEVIQYALK